MYRVEDKFACSERDLFLLQSRLGAVLRTDDNQENQDGYCVTSVYFDDIADSSLHDSEEGYRLREKYRIRIYNHSYAVIKLEVKYKRDNKVFKRSETISLLQMQSLLSGEQVRDEAPSMDSPVTLFNLAIMGKMLRPKIIVEYDRKAFIYTPGNVRITLDRNIRGSRDIEAFKKCETARFRRLPEDSQVLEVKYDEFLPGFIAGMLESGNRNQVSYSKYGLCRAFSGGY